MSHFEVFVRPMGGVQLASACCSDGLTHFFTVQPEEPGSVAEVPVCGGDVQPFKTSTDADPMCETCTVAGMSWAQGGTLKVTKDEP